MVTASILLNAHTTPFSGTHLGDFVDLGLARIVLNLALASLARIIFFTSLACMHCLIVSGADEEVACDAAEDVAYNARVVDLAGGAAGVEAVAEVGHRAEEAASGEFVEPIAWSVSLTF
jgi:hypothetical protein